MNIYAGTFQNKPPLRAEQISARANATEQKNRPVIQFSGTEDTVHFSGSSNLTNKNQVKVGLVVTQGDASGKIYEVRKIIGPGRNDPALFLTVKVHEYKVKNGQPDLIAKDRERVLRLDGTYRIVRQKGILEKLADKVYGIK